MKQKETVKKVLDSLSAKSQRWINAVAQQLNDPDANGYIDNEEARMECASAGVIQDYGDGYIEIPAIVNDVLYSDGYFVRHDG